jgi:hypothetical protein
MMVEEGAEYKLKAWGIYSMISQQKNFQLHVMI